MPTVVVTPRRIAFPHALQVPVPLLWCLAAAGAAIAITMEWAGQHDDHGALTYAIDVDVYRLGTQAFLAGAPLYGVKFQTLIDALPFIYPPFAAVLFTPLTLFSAVTDAAIMTVISMACTWWCCRAVAQALGCAHATLLAFIAWPCALFLEPVSATIGFGQINLILLALVCTDFFARPRWLPAGVLVGVAAAIKLTPAVFVVVWLVRRDIRAVAMTAAGFLGATMLGALWHPRYTGEFFTSAISSISSYISPATTLNQSPFGIVLRAGLPHAVWVAWVFAIGVTLIVACHRLSRGNMPVLTVATAGVGGLMISPISWYHHFVIAIVVIIGCYAARKEWLAIWWAAAMTIAPLQHMVPAWDAAHPWPWWMWILQANYTIPAVVFLVSMAIAPPRQDTVSR